MPNTIVHLTKREHHELMVIAKMCNTSPGLLCICELIKTGYRFHGSGQLPMLPRPRLDIPRNEFRGYRRVPAKLCDKYAGWIAEIADACRVSKDYIARLAVTQFITDVYRNGMEREYYDFVKAEMADDANIFVRPDRHCGSHLVPGGPLGTMEERQPPNPRV